MPVADTMPPPPPPGFTADSGSAPPPPPPGFTADAPQQSTPPPQPPATPQQQGWLNGLKAHITQARTENQAEFDKHPVLKAIDKALFDPVAFTEGIGGQAMQGLGGLMKIVDDMGNISASPRDVTAYQQANPGASTEQAMQAVTKGFRAPENQGKVDGWRETSDYLRKTGETHGIWQGAGGLSELLTEPLLAPEAAAGDAGKAMTAAEEFANKAKAAKFFADNKPIARVTALGLRALHSAALAGGQTFVHSGGDAGEAKTAAVLGGAGTLALTPLVEGASYLANRAMPALENIFGEDVQTLSSQRPGDSSVPRGSVAINELPAVQRAQQAAAPKVFTNIAKKATYDALEEANASRPYGLLPDDTTPTQFNLRGIVPESETTPPELIPQRNQQYGQRRPVFGKGAADQPNVPNIRGPYPLSGVEREGPPKPLTETEQWLEDVGLKPVQQIGSEKPAIFKNVEGPSQYHMEPKYQIIPPRLEPGGSATKVGMGGGDILTDSPELAQWHLNRLNDVLDDPPKSITSDVLDEMTQHRDELQQQLKMHHFKESQFPNVPRANSPLAASLVKDYGDMHDQLQHAIEPYMARIDAATQGGVSDIAQARATAARRGDLDKFFSTDSQLDNLIDNSNVLNPSERAQVNTLRDKARIAGALDTAVNHAMNAGEATAAQVRGGRVLSGLKMKEGLDKVAQRFGGGDIDKGEAAISKVIGPDGMNAMRRMQDILTMPDSTKPKALKVSMSVMHNIWHGKLLGALGYHLGAMAGGPIGGLGGGALGAATERQLLRMLATSPRTLGLYDFAIRNLVKPEIAGPLISNELLREHGSDFGVMNRTAQTTPQQWGELGEQGAKDFVNPQRQPQETK